MLLIECPFCGPRNELEFAHAGEAHLSRLPEQDSDDAWGEYLYARTNPKGVHAERWRHVNGCGRYFNALRDTTTDHFLAVYKAGEPRPNFAKNGIA